MAQILIRGLDSHIIDRLRARAALHGRSLEGEARSILQSSAGLSAAEARRVLGRWQKELGGRTMGDSVKLIRKDRRR